jgi:uncharacterized protein DUF6125
MGALTRRCGWQGSDRYETLITASTPHRIEGATPTVERSRMFEAMGREDLLRALEMFAKNWLAHDGCWFLAAEERFDMQTAIDLDAVCPVQEARRSKGMADFPCNCVGIVEFETFAATIDPRIRTTCLHCPPETAPGQYCGWEFTIE